jgi:DNA-binding NarL/FixJ family response regulator
MTVRVVVCEDQALVRAGLVTMLRTDPDLTVVGEAPNGDEALALIERVQPDVALVDIRMPGITGLEVTARATATGQATRIIVLTTFGHDAYVYEALRAGASAFLLKDTRPEDLLLTVHAVAAGEARLDPAVTASVVGHFRTHAAPPAADERIARLTTREREVLVLVANGLTNAEIAARLFVAPGTVKAHIASLLAKLGARDRVQAVIAAYETGLVRA